MKIQQKWCFEDVFHGKITHKLLQFRDFNETQMSHYNHYF